MAGRPEDGTVVPFAPRTSGAQHSYQTFESPNGSTWVNYPPGRMPDPPGGGGSDMSDWKASVEGRLTDLRDDYRTLLRWGIGAVTFILIGGGYISYEIVKDVGQVRAEVSKVDGKIDILLERPNGEPQRSD